MMLLTLRVEVAFRAILRLQPPLCRAGVQHPLPLHLEFIVQHQIFNFTDGWSLTDFDRFKRIGQRFWEAIRIPCGTH